MLKKGGKKKEEAGLSKNKERNLNDEMGRHVDCMID